MEKIVADFVVSGHRCLGCQRHRRQVMVTLRDKADVDATQFVEIFLTGEQAKALAAEIIEAAEAADGYSFPADD